MLGVGAHVGTRSQVAEAQRPILAIGREVIPDLQRDGSGGQIGERCPMPKVPRPWHSIAIAPIAPQKGRQLGVHLLLVGDDNRMPAASELDIMVMGRPDWPGLRWTAA
jgi:hypothetical protein